MYQILIARTLIFIGGDQIALQCLTIGIYIASLGLGTFLASKIKKNNQIRVFFQSELLLSFIGGLSPVILFFGFIYFRNIYETMLLPLEQWKLTYLNQILIYTSAGQIITILIGVLSGMELPLIIQLSKIRENKDQKINLIFGINYIGALFGTIAISIWAADFLSLIQIAVIVGLFNILVCIYLWCVYPQKISILSKGLFFIVIFLHCLTFGFEKFIMNRFLAINYYGELGMGTNAKKVEHIQTQYQNIDIVTSSSYPYYLSSNADIRVLYLNRQFQFSTRTEKEYHEYIVHVPIQVFNFIPKKVLVLGAGDGLLIRELLNYREQIDSITQVELDPIMIEMAKSHPLFIQLNKGSLYHPKVKVELNDAYTFIKNTKEKFDAIYIDFPYPTNYDLSKLYSFEFYYFIRKIINDSGFVVIDHPLFAESKEIFQYSRAVNTIGIESINKAGFQTIIPYFSTGKASKRIDSESFLAFSPSKITPNLNYKQNTSVILKYINEDSLKNLNILEVKTDPKNKKINSIFKPKISSIKDML